MSCIYQEVRLFALSKITSFTQHHFKKPDHLFCRFKETLDSTENFLKNRFQEVRSRNLKQNCLFGLIPKPLELLLQEGILIVLQLFINLSSDYLYGARAVSSAVFRQGRFLIRVIVPHILDTSWVVLLRKICHKG